ncbi:MAG: class I SAM-dependent methyltransferase [Symploca sp. SIO3C6]|nr:class I SAM-dependent methyltransferase [Symploca sp. SIO3C6]
MDKQLKHTMLPQTTHDELARQNFVQSLKIHLQAQMIPEVKEVYEQQAKPRFEQQYQRLPQNRYEIRQVMEQEPYYQWVSVLKRTTQEMLWDSVSTSVERQLQDLVAKAQKNDQSLGSLSIDPNFSVPAYQKVVDIHCMPGGYHTEFIEDDVALGAIYDRGVYIYGLGWLGPLNDDLAQSAIFNYLKQDYPDFEPAKILDLGCSVGHSTLPYVDAYPNAQVYAIDVAAPMLRYAHARAQALGKRVHFSQQNAEHTNFADESFELIVSHILLHEIPVPVIRNVVRECYRLLAPGGVMVHVDAPLYRHMDPYTAFLSDWQTTNNNEPFWSAMRDSDLKALAISVGFEVDQVIETFAANGVWLKKNCTDNHKSRIVNSRGNWFIFAAKK